MSQVLFALRWYLVVQVFGLAALPLCLRLFRHLPDHGYGVSKPLGLLLAGWFFWLMTAFGWTHNTAGGILVALTLLFVAGAVIFLSGRLVEQSVGCPPWRTVLATEIIFTLAFAGWCLVRAHMPCIQTAGGEKWMEIAFLRAILRSETFPPHDPWLSGFAISYYYFGYVIIAMLTRLAYVPPPIAFNLAIAMLFALTCTGAFSLVYNLIAVGVKSQPSQSQFPILGGLLGPLLVAVMGNLEGLLEVLHARGIGPGLFWVWLDIGDIGVPPLPFADGSWVPKRFFWWWQASRVLKDYDLRGAAQLVIDESPVFSFILGDMHPHVLALPFVLLAIALALNLYIRIVIKGKQQMANGQPRTGIGSSQLAIWEFFIYALCLGGLGFLNTWDFPIYLFVVTVACALALLRTDRGHQPLHLGWITNHAPQVIGFFFSLLVAGVLLFLPFWIGFQSQAGGILINLFNPTRLPQFLVMFGPLLFIAAIFIIDQARRGGVRVHEIGKWTLVVALSILGALVLVLGLAILLIRLDVIPAHGAMAYLAAWVRSEPIPYLEGVANAHSIVTQRMLLRLFSPWTALCLVAFLVASVFAILKQMATVAGDVPIVRDFVLFLLATGTLLALSVEYIFLRDIFLTRMNTVFKFYFQAWVMWGIAGAYALAHFIKQRRAVVVIVAVLLVAAGLIYPVLAIPARAGEYGGSPTLDGAEYLAGMYPDDYYAIAWLNENVSGAPVILEAPGGAYVYESRVSAHTGLPTLLGWAGHEHQWRGNYDEQARREPDIETLYTSVNPEEVLSLMDKYNISYVYVGPVERSRYPAAGLTKFAGFMDIVYDTGAVTIYHYQHSVDK
jgi:YYY domain-containing protein